MMEVGDGVVPAASYEEQRVPSSISRLLQVMHSYGRELCFVVAVIFTTFAAMHNGPLKTRKANPPQKFFEASSLITDFYKGDLEAFATLLPENDILFVMYYAPWDAMCIQFREELEMVARHRGDQVFFIAVNCWWPGGECRQTYNLQSYPIFILHVRNVGFIQYRGPLSVEYLLSFLDRVLTPFVRIRRRSELFSLLAQHEGVLVGFFDFHASPQPPGFHTFFQASVVALSRDPTQRLRFAVVTNGADSLAFRITRMPSLVLYTWNMTEVYQKSLQMDSYLSWAFKNLNEVVSWVNIPQTKSKMLSREIGKVPTLILFTPRLLLTSSSYYDMMKEVALDYFSCDRTTMVDKVIGWLSSRRSLQWQEYNDLRVTCELPIHVASALPECQEWCDWCCHSVLTTSAVPCVCHLCVRNVTFQDAAQCTDIFNAFLARQQRLQCMEKHHCTGAWASYPVLYNPYYHISQKCLNFEQTALESKVVLVPEERSLTEDIRDDKIVSMIRASWKRKCRDLALGEKRGLWSLAAHPSEGGVTGRPADFSGLGCRTNRTLKFVMVDSVQFSALTTNLGFDIHKRPHLSAVAIYEIEQENQYFLQETVSKASLETFIVNYTRGLLSNYLRSPVWDSGWSDAHSDSHAISVAEVTSITFNNVVMDADQDVVLMYYAPWCGFCQGVAHVFLAAARYFSGINGIRFARINGDANDLPWEFTADKYPTIVFFPAQRKAESMKFPSSLQITTSHLVGFVMANAQSTVRQRMALLLCDRQCRTRNFYISMDEIRRLFLRLKFLYNQLHFVHEFLAGDALVERNDRPDSFGAGSVQETTLKSYLSYLVHAVTVTKRQLYQARQLQEFLRERLQDGSAKTDWGFLQEVNTSVPRTKATRRQQKDEL